MFYPFKSPPDRHDSLQQQLSYWVAIIKLMIHLKKSLNSFISLLKRGCAFIFSCVRSTSMLSLYEHFTLHNSIHLTQHHIISVMLTVENLIFLPTEQIKPHVETFTMLEYNITIFFIVTTLLLCLSLLLLGTHRGIGGEHTTVTSVMD